MPSVEWNQQKWNESYHWDTGGDLWSNTWGSVDMQWYGTIMTRLHPFVPTGTILEIAPGFGRWTHYLKDLCDNLKVVDLSPKCIETCQERFKDESHIEYHVNDGTSLDMIPDNSIDLVYSFDSLVHVELEVLEAYLKQLKKKLKPHGVGFFHHSNIGHYQNYFKVVRGIPLLRNVLRPFGVETKLHDRAVSVTAEKFEHVAEDVGLPCISQEKINWSSPLLIDCISTFTQAGSKWSRSNKVVSNPHFMQEAHGFSVVSELYSSELYSPSRKAA